MGEFNKFEIIKRKLIQSDQVMLIVLFITVCVIFGFLSPYFFTLNNFLNILRQGSYNAIAAVGVAYTVIAGGIDLSVGSMQGLIGVIVVIVLISTNSVLLAILVGILIGVVLGFINGFIITKLGVIDIIATLAMFFTLRGVGYVLTNANSISNTTSTFFNWIGVGYIFYIPAPVIWTIIIYIFFGVILKFTVLGRYVYAIGGDKNASILNGIKFNKIKMLTYIFSGFTASIAAIILAARMNSGQPNAGIGLEFTVVAAVIIGGCSLLGGRGGLVGTLLGVLFLTMIRNGLVLLNVPSFYQQIITGLILIAAVAFDYRKQLLLKKL